MGITTAAQQKQLVVVRRLADDDLRRCVFRFSAAAAAAICSSRMHEYFLTLSLRSVFVRPPVVLVANFRTSDAALPRAPINKIQNRETPQN